MSRYITKKDNQWPASTWILLTLEKCKVESTRTCYHTPTSMAKMRSTDSSRYACGCVEEVDALRQRPDLLSMTWLCPRCSESWQPPSPTLPQLPQLHLAKVTVTAGWRAQRTSPPGPTWDELRGHSHSLGPRLLWALHCSSASLSLRLLLLPATPVILRALLHTEPCCRACFQEAHPGTCAMGVPTHCLLRCALGQPIEKTVCSDLAVPLLDIYLDIHLAYLPRVFTGSTVSVHHQKSSTGRFNAHSSFFFFFFFFIRDPKWKPPKCLHQL